MTTWLDLAHELPALTLDEVDEKAALQVRVDRKYVVAGRTWGEEIGRASWRERVSSYV